MCLLSKPRFGSLRVFTLDLSGKSYGILRNTEGPAILTELERPCRDREDFYIAPSK